MKGIFVGYCENSKANRIYVLGQRYIEFRRDVTFYEVVFLGKSRDTPPPANVETRDDALDGQEDSPMHEPNTNVDVDLMEPMDPLDTPPCDLLTRKRPLWLHDTLQDVERHVVVRGFFRERKNPY